MSLACAVGLDGALQTSMKNSQLYSAPSSISRSGRNTSWRSVTERSQPVRTPVGTSTSRTPSGNPVEPSRYLFDGTGTLNTFRLVALRLQIQPDVAFGPQGCASGALAAVPVPHDPQRHDARAQGGDASGGRPGPPSRLQSRRACRGRTPPEGQDRDLQKGCCFNVTISLKSGVYDFFD